MYIEIISLLLLAVFVASEDYYDVPSYYGHFSLDYFLPNFINNSTLVKL